MIEPMLLSSDEAGAGPAVLLLHAGVADRRMWSDQLPLLADASYRAIAPDLPGFGQAPRPSASPWLDVLSTMDALGIERAVLVGCSFGGAIAQRIAFAAPERVSALVLVCSPAPELDPSPELAAAWEAEEDALERGDIDAAVAASVDAWTLDDASPELRERVAEMQRRAFELAIQALDPGEAPDPVEDDPSVIAGLHMPALIVTGGRDFIDFASAADWLADRLPNAKRVTLEDAGHLPPLEQPAVFGRLLIEFLDGLPHA
jgi:pimeloyl-ACP methyl ester carboxylesterase